MKYALSVLLFFALHKIQAQVNFNTASLDQALLQAKTEGKLVFMQFEAATCDQCNDVANKGFENKELSERLEQIFVCLRVTPDHMERSKIAAAYNLNEATSFGSFMLDNNGTLLQSYRRTTSNTKAYLEQIDLALSRAGEASKISELEREYNNGNHSFGFIEALLWKRKILNLPTDSLLNEYIDVLPPDSLEGITTLRFIMQMAPILDSKPYQVLRRNGMLFNQVWYALPSPARSAINHSIIYKSLQKAIKEHDEHFALRTASFARGTYITNYTAGAKAYEQNMLRYYDEIKDTATYFRKAIAYYDRYFMSVNPDSVRKSDSVYVKRMLQSQPVATIRQGDSIIKRRSVAIVPGTSRFSNELNTGASHFYELTNNSYLLSIATEWSKRSLSFFETPEAYETYAKLLYKQSHKQEAIEAMNKAITLQNKRKLPTKNLTTTLDLMIHGKELKPQPSLKPEN